MRWALKRRTIRPMITVCLLALIFTIITVSPAFTQTSRSFIKVKDLPKIIPDPDIQYGEPGDDNSGRYDYLASAYPYDPNRRDDKEEVVIRRLAAPINYYYWLSNYIPLLKQIVLGF